MIQYLSLDKLQIKSHPRLIFYSDGNYVVYKDKFHIHITNCDGKLLFRCMAPPDCRHFECTNETYRIAIVINGNFLLYIGTEPFTCTTHDIDSTKIGKCVTKIKFSEANLVFGTKCSGRLQIVKYDPFTHSRINQTASHELNRINCLSFEKNHIYALMDNSIIVNCNMSTGETIQRRFEAGYISNGLVVHKSGILYASQGVLNHYTNKVEKTKIPYSKVHSIEAAHKENLYFTSEEGQKIGCLNLADNKIKWEIKSDTPIQESILVEGPKKQPALIVRLANAVSIINLEKGEIARNLPCPSVYRIRQTGKNILLHKQDNRTDIIIGRER